MPARKHLRHNKTRTHPSRVAFKFFIQIIYALMHLSTGLRKQALRSDSCAEPCRLQFQLMHLPQFVMSMLA
jgi:hypothetical protein